MEHAMESGEVIEVTEPPCYGARECSKCGKVEEFTSLSRRWEFDVYPVCRSCLAHPERKAIKDR
jgi:hypothetical protein